MENSKFNFLDKLEFSIIFHQCQRQGQLLFSVMPFLLFLENGEKDWKILGSKNRLLIQELPLLS